MRIGLGLFFLSGFDEALMRGIAAYARPERPWTFDLRYPTEAGLLEILERKPSGILVRSQDQGLLKWLAHSGPAIVNLDPISTQVGVSFVANDDVAIGRMAAAHFIGRGFVHFAFFGRTPDVSRSERLEGFLQEVSAIGAVCHELNPQALEHRALPGEHECLRQLPKPIGVFCASDEDARFLGEQAKEAGIKLPEQMALLGTDNDVPTCSLGHPQLSSVETAGRKIGYEASRVLEALMNGGQLGKTALRVPPVRVVTRRSSEVMGAPDELTRRALEYMAAHRSEPLAIKDLAAHLQCSRRVLERRFHTTTRVSPAQAWLAFRVEEASRLLADTDLPLALVAELSGFGRLERLSEAMRKVTGLTAIQFRRHAAP